MEFEDANVRSVYESIAPFFQHTRTYVWDWIPYFIEGFPNTALICDIGCGNGRNMLPYQCKFIGIDNCQNLLYICRQKSHNVILSDMCNLPINAASVDGILSIASFHHLQNIERRQKALGEMYRILREGGRVLLSVWSIKQPKKTRRTFKKYGDTMVPWNQRGEIYIRYYYIFRIEELRELIINAGFKIKFHFWNCGNEVFELEKLR